VPERSVKHNARAKKIITGCKVFFGVILVCQRRVELARDR